MHGNLYACVALSALLLTGFEADAANSCAAGNPNTTSLAESTPTSAFVNNTDGTVTHKLTGLMWKRCPQGLSGENCTVGDLGWFNWQQALQSAAADTTADYADWRLPNKKELESIVETCGYDPVINLVAFPATQSFFFWAGSTDVQSPDLHWAVNFQNGSSDAHKTMVHPVRLVRSGRTFSAADARTALGCTLDIDGNGKFDALTDGLILIRALFGLTGAAATNGALGPGATRIDWEELRVFMNDNCGTNFQP